MGYNSSNDEGAVDNDVSRDKISIVMQEIHV